MQIRQTLKNYFVRSGRGYRREAISRTTLTDFEYRGALLLCRYTVEHFAFTAAAAPGMNDALSAARCAGVLHQLMLNLRGYHLRTVSINNARMFDHILIA